MATSLSRTEPAESQRQVRRDRAERVRDHGLRRAEPAEHRIQRLRELQSIGTPRTRRTVVGIAVCRPVEHDHPMAGLEEGVDHRTELRTTPTPAVHQVHRLRRSSRVGNVAPHMSAHHVALCLDLERLTPVRDRQFSHPWWRREPQVPGKPPCRTGQQVLGVTEIGSHRPISDTNDRACLIPCHGPASLIASGRRARCSTSGAVRRWRTRAAGRVRAACVRVPSDHAAGARCGGRHRSGPGARTRTAPRPGPRGSRPR